MVAVALGAPGDRQLASNRSFCGSLMHLKCPEDPVEEAPAYLPFAVDPSAAAEGLRRRLGALDFFRPSDLQAATTMGSRSRRGAPASPHR